MKSLLVDALRQANDCDAELEQDNLLRSQEAPVEPDGDRGEEKTASATALELMQTGQLSTTVEFGSPSESSDSTRIETVRQDDDNSVAALGLTSGTGATVVFSQAGLSRPRMLEGYVAWIPVVCLSLGSAAAGLHAVWDQLIGDNLNTDLRALSVLDQIQPQTVGTTPFDAAKTRFPLVATDSTVNRVRDASGMVSAQSVTAGRPKQMAAATVERDEIEINTHVATTGIAVVSLSTPTFSSLDSAYQSHVSGDLSGAGLTTVLAQKLERDLMSTLAEVKLLLQRYPDAAPLHFALGNYYASHSRWPEARVSFSRASAINGLNPNYIYNLAVSQDWLGKRADARRLYEAAAQLAGTGSPEQ